MLSNTVCGIKCPKLDKTPEDFLILDEINAMRWVQDNFESIRTQLKVFHIFFPFQKDKGIGAIVKDIYFHFITNRFLIRSEYKLDFLTLRDNLFTISQLLTFFNSSLIVNLRDLKLLSP